MIIKEVDAKTEPIVLRWYAWGGHKDFYYEAVIGAESQIAFFYRGTRRESRGLSHFESGHLLGHLQALRLPISDGRKRSKWILPTVPTCISVTADGLDFMVSWTNSDADAMPDVFDPLERLCSAMRAMLDIDTKGLDLPVYM